VDQATAKAAIDALHARIPVRLTLDYANRAKRLIDVPDELDQGYYGTCGPISAIYTLLRLDREKFVALVTAVFDDTAPEFNHIRVTPDKLYDARVAEIGKKAAMYGGGYDHGHDLDFFLAGGLYTFLQRKDPALYDQQRDYSEHIVRLVGTTGNELVLSKFPVDLTAALTAGVSADPSHGRKQAHSEIIRVLASQVDPISRKLGYPLDGLRITSVIPHPALPDRWVLYFDLGNRGVREFIMKKAGARDFHLISEVPYESGGIGFATGDLALNQDGIKALMSEVVGVPSATLIVRRDPRAEERVREALAKPNSYVIGLVKGYDEWRNASMTATARTFAAPATPPAKIEGLAAPDIEHHLIVTRIARNGTNDDFDVWSWGTPYTVNIKITHTGSYFYGYLVGQVV
jgi:hypothetical protein